MIEGLAHDADSGGAPLLTALVGSLRGVITFFYYDDLAPAVSYYRDLIGFRPALTCEGCVVFDVAPGVRLGLVDPIAGSQRPIAGVNKGAILSLEVDDLDACLERLKRLGAAEASTRILHGCAGRTREFKALDPGGYTIEFFCWTAEPAPAA